MSGIHRMDMGGGNPSNGTALQAGWSKGEAPAGKPNRA